MSDKKLIYTVIILSCLAGHTVVAQKASERRQSVTIKRVVVDGKVLQSDTVTTTTDTVPSNVNSREVSKELPYAKGATVHIENRYRKINIRRSGDNKIRLSTTAFYYGAPAFTDEQWLDKLNIKMRKSESGIDIASGGTGPDRNYSTTSENYSSSQSVTTRSSTSSSAASGTVTVNRSVTSRVSTGTSTAVFDEKGNISYYSNSLKRELTLYIPADAKLELGTVYADVTIDHDLTDITVKITNGALDMMNAGNAVIVSTYTNISAGNIANGRISITNGKLSMKNVNRLQLDSRYAKIDAAKCDSLQIKSQSDDYNIDEVRSLVATKNYGSLKIDKLTGSLDLKGTSADVKIRRIDPAVSIINIDDRYADVALPVAGLKNYEVVFSGDYSSVFAPFEKKTATPEKRLDQQVVTTTGTTASGTITTVSSSPPPRNNNQSFTAVVGNMNDAPTTFKLSCNSCSVDFK